MTPYQSLIEQYLTTDPKLPATVLFHRLHKQGYPGSYSVVKRHLASQRPLWLKDASPKQAFLSIDFAPAQCAQVDWGEFGDVFGNGTKIHCFVMVLSFFKNTNASPIPNIKKDSSTPNLKLSPLSCQKNPSTRSRIKQIQKTQTPHLG